MKLATLTMASLLLVATLLFEPSEGIPRPSALVSTRRKAPNKMFNSKQQQRKRPVPTRRNAKYEVGVQSVDYFTILKYIVALYVQTTFSVGMWMIVDWAIKKFSSSYTNSRWFTFALVYFLNLKVGIFNPQCTVSERVAGDLSPDRKRPSWTPPGWMFVLMWPLFVFGTRAYTMIVVAEKANGFVNPVTIAMMFHFSIGGLWSHVNRIQQELGVSMLLLWGLFATKAYTAYLAYQIVPGAGIALACTLSWLGAAASLGSATWRLNPDPNTGKNQSLVPRKVVPKYP